jgi:hypothetical protein
MMIELSNKRNGRKVSFLYPQGGNKNVLRRVEGVKIKSFTGPGGKGITVHESTGLHKSFSVSKIVASLS